MARVRVIISTIRYGSNGFKHFGEEFNLPAAKAKEQADQGLVEILNETEEETADTTPKPRTPRKPRVKELKEPEETKELKEDIQTK